MKNVSPKWDNIEKGVSIVMKMDFKILLKIPASKIDGIIFNFLYPFFEVVFL